MRTCSVVTPSFLIPAQQFIIIRRHILQGTEYLLKFIYFWVTVPDDQKFFSHVIILQERLDKLTAS